MSADEFQAGSILGLAFSEFKTKEGISMAKKTAKDILEDLALHWTNEDPPEDGDQIGSHVSQVKRCAAMADDYDTQGDWKAVVDELEEVIALTAQALATLRNTKDLSR